MAFWTTVDTNGHSQCLLALRFVSSSYLDCISSSFLPTSLNEWLKDEPHASTGFYSKEVVGDAETSFPLFKTNNDKM